LPIHAPSTYKIVAWVTTGRFHVSLFKAGRSEDDAINCSMAVDEQHLMGYPQSSGLGRGANPAITAIIPTSTLTSERTPNANPDGRIKL
jgi:xanthine dehydrogenase molybdopterin-binding subunit B